jgi:hypothetical protein
MLGKLRTCLPVVLALVATWLVIVTVWPARADLVTENEALLASPHASVQPEPTPDRPLP